MKRFITTAQDDVSLAFSQSLLWAVPAIKSLSIAAAFDHGRWTESDFAKLLSAVELQRAGNIDDDIERRHFIYRRCFQRAFLQTVLKWPGALDEITIEHQQDTQPVCLNSPGLNLSFSSSAAVFLAAASDTCLVGIDLEKMRPIENVDALARRFFTRREAKIIESLPASDRDLAFLRIWTAKEAGLKAIGKGIVSGLNSFVVTIDRANYAVEFNGDLSPGQTWILDYLDFLPGHVVAVVHRVDK
jgi:4'-phosphopantetheinyl transferase